MLSKSWKPVSVADNALKNQWDRNDIGKTSNGGQHEMMLNTDLCLAFEFRGGALTGAKEALGANDCQCLWLRSPTFSSLVSDTWCGGDRGSFGQELGNCCPTGGFSCDSLSNPTGIAIDTIKMYASDEAVWIVDFKKAWAKATTNGFSDLKPLVPTPRFREIGNGHCVDSLFRRPPHCYTLSLPTLQSCQVACENNDGCSAFEWGQPGGSAVYCQLIYTSGIAGQCPSLFIANPVGQGGNAVTSTAHNTGGKCYVTDTSHQPTNQPSLQFDDIGPGHCVDSHSRRPPHCYTLIIPTLQSCQMVCEGDSACSAFEWGQPGGNSVYCQLIYASGIVGQCPSSFIPNPVGQGGDAVTQTAHNTGGRCYVRASRRLANEFRVNVGEPLLV